MAIWSDGQAAEHLDRAFVHSGLTRGLLVDGAVLDIIGTDCRGHGVPPTPCRVDAIPVRKMATTHGSSRLGTRLLSATRPCSGPACDRPFMGAVHAHDDTAQRRRGERPSEKSAPIWGAA